MPKMKPVEGSEATPFGKQQIREAYERLRSLPVVGEPVRPMLRGRRGVVAGETYEQVKAYLLPVILDLYRKGYNREMIQEKLKEALRVGKTSRYLRQLMRDSHEAYCESLMGVKA